MRQLERIGGTLGKPLPWPPEHYAKSAADCERWADEMDACKEPPVRSARYRFAALQFRAWEQEARMQGGAL